MKEMTHLEEYNKIINFRKSNPLPENQYGENHHIKPKSIYPELVDDKDNIVRLSAQEHFLAHYHLWKAYKDELHEKEHAKKMCYALYRMKRQLMKSDDIIEMSKLYEEIKIERLKTENNPMFGKHLSEEHKQKLRKPRSEETKNKISQTLKGVKLWLGRHHSEKSKEKMSKTKTGSHHYNNGVVNIWAKECPEGFVRGWLPRSR